ATAADVPPSPPDTVTTAELAPKRPWWPFGRSRRNRDAGSPPQDAEPVASDSDAATSFGWNIRQAEDSPKPHWARRGDSKHSGAVSSNAESPAHETEAGPETAEAAAPSPDLSLDETVAGLEAAPPEHT